MKQAALNAGAVASLSIIIPTIGRLTLDRTLESVLAAGAGPQDEVIVVGDGPQPTARAIAARFAGRLKIIYFETPVFHHVGHPQRNAGMAVASGSHVMSIDDDDAYRPGALQLVHRVAAAEPGRILIFRMESQTVRLPWKVLWNGQFHSLGNVGTPMFVVPNVERQLGVWGRRHAGDWDFLDSTLERWPGGSRAIVWREEIIADVY